MTFHALKLDLLACLLNSAQLVAHENQGDNMKKIIGLITLALAPSGFANTGLEGVVIIDFDSKQGSQFASAYPYHKRLTLFDFRVEPRQGSSMSLERRAEGEDVTYLTYISPHPQKKGKKTLMIMLPERCGDVEANGIYDGMSIKTNNQNVRYSYNCYQLL